MPQRNVATNFTFEQQRVEINELASDFWTQKTTVDNAAPTYLKLDGSNAFTGATLAVPNAFTINSNSGNGTVTISGNLDVTGTTTTVSSANLEVTDKNILIAKGSTSDAQADGAGITIDSATDITFNFVDAKDALVSSIGLEATTTLAVGGLSSLQGAQFKGTQTSTTGYGVEITAPDANTGQVIAYNRDTTSYKDLRLKGASVAMYAGTTNALIGGFHNTGLTMESGKTITGNVTGDLTGTSSKVNLTSESASATAFRVPFTSANSGSVELYADNSDGITYKPSDGTLSVQKLEGTIVTAAQTNITSVGTLTDLQITSHLGLGVAPTEFGSGVKTIVLQGGSSTKSGAIHFKEHSSGTGLANIFVQNDTTYGLSIGTICSGEDGDFIRFHTGALGSERLRIKSNGQIDLGTSGINQAQFCQAGNNHYIVGQAADNVAALEVYSQHGSSASKISFGVYDNRTGSKSASFMVLGNGTVKPGSDNAQDLGTTTARWANVYTGDMHLNNMNSGGNEVDGSEGHWTMQEGSDDLFLINRNTGKKYKFNLTEVS